MNARIFWRLVWKEYRMQRAFWIAMLLLVLFLELLLLASTGMMHDARWAVGGSQRVLWLFGFAVALPAFYALGCGATTFATEHETGTFAFQRMLPVTAATLFFAKLALAAASTLMMIGLLWPAAFGFAGGRTPGYEVTAGLWALWGFAAVELLVWGVFFSLLSTHPLKATILAVAGASLGVHLVTSFYVRTGYDFLDLDAYTAALPARAVVAVVVGLADAWLGFRWFRERVSPWPAAAVASRGEEAQAAGRLGAGATMGRAPGFGRLVWQTWRQSGSMIGVLSGAMAVVVFWALGLSQGRTGGLPVLLIVPLLSLMGASVFLADKRREGFRFLAERGTSPRAVWLSRQLVWTAAAGFWTIVGLLMLTWLFFITFHRIQVPGETASRFFLIPACAAAAAAYAAGQLSSMVFRSGILAGVFALVLTGLLCLWAGLMLIGGVPWLWSVAPIPLVLLLATWVRAPSWMLERNTFRGWLPTALVLAVPAAAILVAVPLYRAYEIPLVDPGFSPREFARPMTADEKATVALYREASKAYVWKSARGNDKDRAEEPRTGRSAGELDAATIAWVDRNREAIRLTLQASRRPAPNGFDPSGSTLWHLAINPLVHDVQRLGHLLTASARVLEAEGNLDEALEHYLAALRVCGQLRCETGWLKPADVLEAEVYDRLPRWAARRGQTRARIVAAIGQVETVTGRFPSPADLIKRNYLLTRRVIAADPEAMSAVGMDNRQAMAAVLRFRWMPWERVRALRVLNARTAADLYRMHELESQVRDGKKIAADNFVYRGPRPRFTLDDLWFQYSDPWSDRRLARPLLDMETRRRAARLLLAIEGWRQEHGELPETLDVLVGPYFDHLPLDPYSAEPFRYFPEGVPLAIIPPDERRRVEPETVVEPNTPILWSAGPLVSFETVAGTLLDRARLRRDLYSRDWIRPTLELQIWQAGWPFPVP